MIQRDFVDFLHNQLPIFPCVREDEFETNWVAQAFASKSEEKFDPAHQALKEIFSFRVDFVNETIECLFMPLDKVDEGLDCLVWVMI